MGNDGGDIPRRKQLVKQKKKQEIAVAEIIARAKARFCNLTNQFFKQPLAVCKMGYIYNYELVLAAAVKKQLPSKYSYIQKLSDIKQVKIERTTEGSINYIACPITKIQYNGFNKFVALWSCGHVLSRKAFKVVKTEDQQRKCIVCDMPYKQKDVIDLNLEGQQLNARRNYLIKKTEKKEEMKKEKDQEQQKMGQPRKKIKVDSYVSPIDRLGGQFRDVLRQRQKFKKLFHKN